MGVIKSLLSLISKNLCNKCEQQSKEKYCKCCKEKIVVPEKAEKLLSVSQAGKSIGVTRQAIHFAIKMKRLNARKENNEWLINSSDLEEYLGSRYSRAKSRVEGELIFDKKKGYYSIAEAAKFLNKNMNHIYYLVRIGKLKTHRMGAAIVIKDSELHNYCNFIDKDSNKNLNQA